MCKTCDYTQYNTCYTCKKIFCIDCSKEFISEDDYVSGERSEISRRLFPRYSCSDECTQKYKTVKDACNNILPPHLVAEKNRRNIAINIGKVIKMLESTKF
jgi:hypothetical protein